jgi:ubiquinol-cytochrome c reductase cytochrome c1 subunit
MTLLKQLIATLVFIPALAGAASEGLIPLDRAPAKTTDMSALQSGAKLFVNYCLNCHAAASMRYSRLQDLGLTEAQIKDNLLFTGERVGDLMKITMVPKDAKAWFGAAPPDLSVIARAKASPAGSGADWLYTYLRSYYKDDSKPTGWNNLVFEDVAMPHALWELQGIRTAVFDQVADPHDATKTIRKFVRYETVKQGTLTPVEFDYAVANLVGYLEWMAEPAQNTRKRLGVWVLLFLGVFSVLAWRLNASYWKDIK